MLALGLLFLGAAGVGHDIVADPPARSLATTAPTDHRGAVADEALNDVLDEYCVRCHNDRRLRGNMSLDGFDVATPEARPEVAEKIIHKLRAGMMPPVGVRRPPEDSLALVASSLEDRLDALARERPDPGRRTFQRLNRAEYEASIRDLFGIEIDASAYLPTETLSENFDNIADTADPLGHAARELHARGGAGQPRRGRRSGRVAVDDGLQDPEDGLPGGARRGHAARHPRRHRP